MHFHFMEIRGYFSFEFHSRSKLEYNKSIKADYKHEIQLVWNNGKSNAIYRFTELKSQFSL